MISAKRTPRGVFEGRNQWTALLIVSILVLSGVYLLALNYIPVGAGVPSSPSHGSTFTPQVRLDVKAVHACAASFSCSVSITTAAFDSIAFFIFSSTTGTGTLTAGFNGHTSNTFGTRLQGGSINPDVFLYYAANVTAGTHIAYANSSTSVLMSVDAIAIQGSAGIPNAHSATATISSSVVNSLIGQTSSACAISNAVGNELDVEGVSLGATLTITPGGSQAQQDTGSVGTNNVWETDLQNPAGSGAATMTATWGGSSQQFVAACVAFYPSDTLTVAGAPTVGAMTTTTAALSWTVSHTHAQAYWLVSGAMEYAIYSGSACGSYTVSGATVSPPYTSGTVTGLTSGTEYCFKAEVTNTSGIVIYSSASSVASTVPNVPTGLTEVSGTPTTTTAIGLTWTNPTTNPASGVLTVSDVNQALDTTGACGAYSQVYSSSVVTSYTATGLTSGDAYCFTVAAETSGGAGASSTALTSAPTITAAPTSLTVGTITTTTVVLTWTAPTTLPASGVVTSYSVQSILYSGSCGTFGGTETIASGGTYTGLSAGTSYCFRVAAVDAGGTSTYSTAVSNTFTLPDVVTSLAASSIATTTLTVSWTNPTGTTTDEVKQATYSGSCGGYASLTSGTLIVTYGVTGLAGGTAYCFEAAASDASGQGAFSVLSNVLTLPAAPGAPTEGSATTTTIPLSWSTVTGATSYTVLQAAYTGSCGTYSTTYTGEPEPYTVTGLTIGNAYCFEIEAVDATGTGPASAALSNADTLTAAPTALASGTVTTTTVVLTWTAPSTSPSSGVVTSYTVQMAAYSSGCGTYGSSETVASGGTYTGLSAGNTYCFEVAAVDDGGTSVYSSAITNVFTLPDVVTSLSSGTYTTTGLTLTWTNPTGTSNNQIWQATYSGSCGSYSSIDISGGAITTYAVTSLTAGTAYCFQVQAGDGSGYGAAITLTDVMTLPAATGTPTEGSATTTTIPLSWSTVTGAASYTVLQAAYTGSCGSYSTSYTGEPEPYTITGLTIGNGYCFEIEAVDASGTGAASSALSNADTLTAAPTSLASGTIATTTVVLTWTAPTTSPSSGVVTSYTVQMAAYSGSCGGYGSPETIASGGSYTGLSSASAYCFKAAAIDSGGTSAFSTAITNVITLTLAPTSVSASPQSGLTSQLNVAWTVAAGPVLNQTVARYGGGSCAGAGTFTNIADPTATALVVGSLSSGTIYSFEVADWDTGGMSAWSACGSGTTYVIPNAPTGLGVTSSTSYTVTLGWTNPGGVLYNDTMLYGLTCGALNTQVSEGVSTSATVYFLSPYTSYCFAVEAWSGSAASLPSATVSATTLSGVPAAPTSFVTTTIAATTISFTWTNPIAQSGSEVNATFYYGTTCGAISGGGKGTWTTSVNLGSALTATTISSLSSLTSYCFSVTLWTQAGQGAQATSLTVITANPVLGAPTGLTYNSASHSAVTLSWTQPTGYPVLFDTIAWTTVAACASGLTTLSTSGPATTTTVSGLASATTYYWEVGATDNGGAGAYSSCVTGATQGATPPMVYNVAAQLVGSTSVELTWVNPSGYMLIDNFVNVSYGNGVCGTWSQTINLGQVAESYMVTGLTAGDTYCLQVTAVDDGSPPSVSVYATTTTATVSDGVILGGWSLFGPIAVSLEGSRRPKAVSQRKCVL